MSHSETTVVHVVRHGEVFNPDKILYGRLDGYRLSDLGRDMAGVVADYFADHDVTTVTASSLQRAQETAAPIAAAHGVTVRTDDRVIEAANYFEGRPVAMATFLHPRSLLQMYNVARPSWGEPYAEILDRMTQALVADTRRLSCPTSCRSGRCVLTLRDADCGTTRANASAPSPR